MGPDTEPPTIDPKTAGDGAGRGIPRATWGFDVFFVCFALFWAVQWLLGMLLVRIGIDLKEVPWAPVAIALPAQIVVVVVGVELVRLRDPNGLATLGIGLDRGRSVLAGVLGYVVISVLWYLGMFIYLQLWLATGMRWPEQQAMTAVKSAFTHPSLSIWVPLLIGFATVIGASMAEELMFRGLLYGWLRRSMAIRPAAVIVGLLFGLVHGQLHTILPLGFLGYMLCYLRERKGGLVSCMIAHSLFNAVNLLLTVYLPNFLNP